MKNPADMLVIVGGGSGGIGTEVCRLLAAKGAAVVSIRFKSDPPLKEPGIVSLKADLRSPREWERVLRIVRNKFGTPDVLINCAGVLIPGTITSLSPGQIRDVLETNISALLYGVRSVLPAMQAKGLGHIITIGSLGGILPMPFEALYSATKFAIRGFCLSLAEELRGTGVHLTLISAGPVETGMLECEAEDDRSEIAFITNPISAQQVAESVLDVLARPRTEVLLPAPSGITAKLLGLTPGLFGICYRLLRSFGKRRKNRFLRRVQKSVVAWCQESTTSEETYRAGKGTKMYFCLINNILAAELNPPTAESLRSPFFKGGRRHWVDFSFASISPFCKGGCKGPACRSEQFIIALCEDRSARHEVTTSWQAGILIDRRRVLHMLINSISAVNQNPPLVLIRRPPFSKGEEEIGLNSPSHQFPPFVKGDGLPAEAAGVGGKGDFGPQKTCF